MIVENNGILKSKNDKKEYKNIILDNKLEILLIHDPKCDKSAASMCVNIGYYNDPENYEGVAHFVEHLLFMGTKKYPDENHFSKYLDDHGGRSNAYTDAEITNYFFDVNSENFMESLDIFANFFISPLMHEDTLTREMKAVDSEHAKNLHSYYWIMQNLIKQIADNTNHPFRKFGTGNLETLNKPNIRKEVVDFYNKYYSSNIMKLVILHKEEFNTIENQIKTIFEKIENKNVEIILNDKPFLYTNIKDDNQFYKLAKCVPINDTNNIEIYWQLSNLTIYSDPKPLLYIFELINHKCDNGLFDILRKKKWLLSLETSIIDDSSMLLIKIKILLTAKGFENIPEILNIIYSYLDLITKKGITEWRYNETKRLAEIAIKYFSRVNPLDYVTNLSTSMLFTPIKYVILESLLYDNYDKKFIDDVNDILHQLVRSKSIIIISSKKYDGKTNLQDKIYGTKYILHNYDESFKNNLGDEFNYNITINKQLLKLPIKNIFIPDNIVITRKLKKQKFPTVIKYKNMSVWHKQDFIFNDPKIYMFVTIKINNTDDLKNNTKILLFMSFLKHNISSYHNYAYLARSDFDIDIDHDKIVIYIATYDSITELISKKILQSIFDLTIDEQNLNTHKSYLKHDIKLQYNEPLHIISRIYLHENIYIQYNSNDILNVINDITVNDIEDVKNIIKYGKLELLIQGNVTKAQSLIISRIFESFIKYDNNDNKQLSNLYNLDSGEEEIIIRKTHNIHEVNSLINILYEINAPNKIRNLENAYLILIKKILNDKYFNQLRTKEQLGYIVNINIIEFVGNNKEYIFGIIFQVLSTNSDSQHLKKRIKSFLTKFYNNITDITEEILEIKKDVLIKNLMLDDRDLMEEFTRNYYQILDKKYVFDFLEILSKEIKKINIIDFKKVLYDTFINKNTRKIRMIKIDNPNKKKINT